MSARVRLAAWLLVPLWLLALVLSARSLATDAVVAPFRAASAVSVDGYPTVTWLPRWAVRADDPADGLRPGDALLRIGGVDARGASSARAISLAWAGMDGTARLPVTVSRDGRVRELVAAIPKTIPKWPTLVVSLVYGGFALLIAWRYAELPIAAVALPTALVTAIWMGSHFGTTPQELLIAFALRAGALVFLQPLAIRLVRHCPDGRPGAFWARGWPMLLGLNGIVLVDGTLFGTLPPAVLDVAGPCFTAVAAATMLAVGVDRYRSSDRVGRRRFKWLLLGVFVATVPPATVAFASAFRPALGAWFLPSQLAQLAVPVCLAIAIARHQLFDIDRLLNVSLVTLGLAGVAVGGGLVVGPGWQAAIVSSTGVSGETAGLALVTAAATVLVPIGLWGLRRLDAWSLRERREREVRIERLLDELVRAPKLRELAELLVERTAAIWGSRGVAVGMRVDDRLVPVAVAGPLAQRPDETSIVALLEPTRSQLAGLRGVRAGSELGVPGDVLVAALRRGEDVVGALVVGPRRSGDAYEPWDCSGLALVAERASAVIADLAHRELLEQAAALHRELEQAKHAAELASERKGRMLATASHDLRQPVQALRLLLAGLEAGAGAAVDDRIDKARRAAASMQQTFERLLDGARLDEGLVEPHREAVSLREVFAGVEAFADPLAREKGLALAFADHALVVDSDPALLHSVVQNLVGNAIRYTDAGEVRVEARRAGDDVEIAVCDSGRGMTAEEQRELFRAGARGASAAGDTAGSGLGLSIVSQLCAVLGHELRLESRVGVGTTFTVRGRAASREEAVGEQGVASVLPADPLEGARVALLENDAPTRTALVATLAGWGVDVVAAGEIADLLDAAGGCAPAVVLLDYSLGDVTGLEALDVLEEHWGPVRAAVLTAETAPGVAERVRARGLVLVRKPAAPVQLRALLTSLLGEPSGPSPGPASDGPAMNSPVAR